VPTTRELWEEQAAAVLRQHTDHTIVINGWHHKILTTHNIAGDDLGMVYAEVPVYCTTCGVSLSQQWD
jgi:hypothetical protein